MSLDEMNWFPSKLKKHSDLEIQRIRDSIIEDGFLFPIAIGKVKDKNYIIDDGNIDLYHRNFNCFMRYSFFIFSKENF